MKESYDNILMSNFPMWLDNYILRRGEAFHNVDSNFYGTSSKFNGFYAYSLPYSQMVYDSSVTGANVPTGVYVNGTFYGKGQGDFVDFSYDRGIAYFSANQAGSSISGRFAVKDFNIILSSEPEEKILFETKYVRKPKVPQIATGHANNEIAYPVIIVRNNGSYNKPLTFGGTDMTCVDVTAYIFADSQYKLDSATSLLRDSSNQYIPLLSRQEMPFNVFGGLKSGVFNYTGAVNGKVQTNEAAFIEQVSVSKFERNLYSQTKILNPDVYFAIVDFSIEKVRNPRESVGV